MYELKTKKFKCLYLSIWLHRIVFRLFFFLSFFSSLSFDILIRFYFLLINSNRNSKSFTLTKFEIEVSWHAIDLILILKIIRSANSISFLYLMMVIIVNIIWVLKSDTLSKYSRKVNEPIWNRTYQARLTITQREADSCTQTHRSMIFSSHTSHLQQYIQIQNIGYRFPVKSLCFPLLLT